MTKNFLTRAAVFAAGILISAAAFAAGGGNLQQSGVDLNDKASLQRGAALYMNYCGGCHSLKYIRYARFAEDLGMSEEDVMANLNFSGGKIGALCQGYRPAPPIPGDLVGSIASSCAR